MGDLNLDPTAVAMIMASLAQEPSIPKGPVELTIQKGPDPLQGATVIIDNARGQGR